MKTSKSAACHVKQIIMNTERCSECANSDWHDKADSQIMFLNNVIDDVANLIVGEHGFISI